MLEAMMHFAVEPFTGFFALGDNPTALDRPRLAQAFIVKCRDGKPIGIHLSSIEKFWDNLVLAIDGQPLAADPRFEKRQGRIDNYLALLDQLNAIFSQHDRAEWVARLERFDLPFGPVNSIPEAAEDIQARHLEMVVPVTERSEGAALAIRPPFNFDGLHARSVKAAPTVDEDGPAIRAALAADPNVWPQRRPAPVKDEDRAFA
jgi:crotonobetainyl-CoA:carnitine CoA-transferase CaiB-like acyl-CoA transferase